MKLGVYSLIAPDYEIEGVAELAARIGYDAVEWTADYAKAVWNADEKWHISTDDLEGTVRRARQACEEHGLDVPCLGCRCMVGDDDATRHYMEVAQMVGAPAIRMFAPWCDGKTHFNEFFERARTQLESTESIARSMGVRATLELHNGNICQSASGAMRLIEGRDPEWIGVIHDAGNMLHEGMENWQMGLEMLGPYLHHVHAKNYAYERREGTWQSDSASLADGMVNWPAVIAALKHVGYDGCISIEDFRGGYACKPVGITTEAKLREDYEYLRGLLQDEGE